MKTIAVIGGGISGIASMFYAQRRHYLVDLYEREDQLGGRVGCTTLSGRSVEFGGKNIGLHYNRFRQFASTFGAPNFEPFGFNSSRAVAGRTMRINKDGSRLRTLFQAWRIVGTQGLRELLPLAAALKRDPRQGFLDTPVFNALAEHADDPPLSEYFSSRCRDQLIRSMTVRMNGAEPDECYLGNFGSNLGLILDNFEQISGGMNRVIQAFSTEGIPRGRLLLGQRVQGIEHTSSKKVLVTSNGKHGPQLRQYDHVVVALPACDAGLLLNSTSATLASMLREIRYFPVAVAIARYESNVFSRDQRAMVLDAHSPLSNAGAYGPSDLNLVRYTFSGRRSRELIRPDTPEDQAIAIGEAELGHHLDLHSNRRDSFVYRYMPKGLCAYSANHAKRLSQIRKATPIKGGITLTGDYWRGASLESCFLAAEEAVNQL